MYYICTRSCIYIVITRLGLEYLFSAYQASRHTAHHAARALLTKAAKVVVSDQPDIGSAWRAACQCGAGLGSLCEPHVSVVLRGVGMGPLREPHVSVVLVWGHLRAACQRGASMGSLCEPHVDLVQVSVTRHGPHWLCSSACAVC